MQEAKSRLAWNCALTTRLEHQSVLHCVIRSHTGVWLVCQTVNDMEDQQSTNDISGSDDPPQRWSVRNWSCCSLLDVIVLAGAHEYQPAFLQVI